MSPTRRLLPLLAILATLSLVPLAASQGTMSITVSTGKSQYLPGETVEISGRVADSQGTPIMGAGVSIQVGDPPTFIQVVYSDSSGAYSVSYFLSTNIAAGQYAVYATASRPGYTPARQQTQFTVLTQTTTKSTSSPSSQPSQCFIATATYGSEIAPEVALLRNFRDAEVMQTSAGRSFMLTFNTFYYSFSPHVASFIASHGRVRSVMRVILYPLVGILYVSSVIFQASSFDGELAATLSGIFAALGIGFVYFGPLAILGGRLVNKRANRRWPIWKFVFLAGCVTSSIALIVVEATGSLGFMAEVAVAVVLSYATLGSLCAKSLASRLGAGKKTEM